MQFHRKVLQALAAETIAVPLFYIGPLFGSKRNAITLALRYITGFAFKYRITPRAFLCFMFAHTGCIYNCTLMPPVKRKGIAL